MYRHAVTSYVMRNSLPSPEYTGDSDSDTEIIQELEQKRRQLDEDVARFRAQKDKEFRDFEASLRSTRKTKHKSSMNDHKTFLSSNNPNTPPSQTEFRDHAGSANPSSNAANRKVIQPRRLMKSDFGAKANSPTLCLDKLNIVGENTLNQYQLHTPPTPSLLTKISSQSSSESLPKSSPSHGSIQKHEAIQNEIFNPSCLPILEAKLVNSQPTYITRPLIESHTEPTSPNGSVTIHSADLQSSSLPSDTHITGDLHLNATKRSYTAPSGLRRNPLAPIIRKNSDRKHAARKRKRVTFQLADRAIVDPSSSYEEGPSPSLESDKGSDSGSSSRSGSISPRLGSGKRVPRDQFGRKISDEDQSGTKDDEVGMGMGDLFIASIKEETEEDDGIAGEQEKASIKDDGYFSPKNGETFSRSPIYVSQRSPVLGEDQDTIVGSNSFEQVDDDRYLLERRDKLRSSKVGTRSPLSSPPIPQPSSQHHSVTTPPRHAMEAPIDPDNPAGNVGFFELDKELASPGADSPAPFNSEDIEDKDMLMIGEDLHTPSRRISSKSAHGGLGVGFAAGSVPIDIVRSGWSSVQGSLTSSWIGTFGH